MKITTFIAVSVIASSLLITACKKKEVDNETQSVVDNALCEPEFLSIGAKTNGAAGNSTGLGAKKIFSLGDCDTLDLVSGDMNWADGTISAIPTFTYNTGTCSNDGKVRSGSITIELFPVKDANNVYAMKNIGSSYKVSLNNYVSNGIKYSSDPIIITNLSNPTTNGVFSYNISIPKGKCQANDGSWTINWEATRTITVDTKNTPTEADDVTTISGSSSGTNREGRTFDVNVTSPLTKPSDCKYITKGTVELTPEGYKTRTVDFGNGSCDDDATFTVNGQTVSFKLK